ncbi:MAG: hypothetical protein V1857_01415 [archaeon]
MIRNRRAKPPKEAISAIESAREIILKMLRKNLSQEEMEEGTWNAAARIEYASALISINCKLADFDPIKKRRRQRPESVEECLTETLRLISESLDKASNDVKSSYTSLRTALCAIRSIQLPQ